MVVWIGGVGDGGGFGGPGGVLLQLQSELPVQHLRGLVPPTEEPGQEQRPPAVVSHL